MDDSKYACDLVDELRFSEYFSFMRSKKADAQPIFIRLEKIFLMNKADVDYFEQLKTFANLFFSNKSLDDNFLMDKFRDKIERQYFVEGNYVETLINNFHNDTPKATHDFNLWVISTTKSNIAINNKLLPQFPLNQYHETDCTLWKPFVDEGTISELIAEYKNEVEFEVKERFLEQNPIEIAEKATFFKNTDKIVLVLDAFALNATNLETAKHFNQDKIGACLILLCQSVSFELFADIRSQIEKTFGVLHTCFLDYKEKYLHFVFPISTKELFFRTLSNIALLRLEIATKIEGSGIKPTLQTKTFKF